MIQEIKNYVKYGKSLPTRLDETIKFYDEHWEKDPNVYEFMTLACDTANTIYSNYNLEDYYSLQNSIYSDDPYAKITVLGNMVKERLLSNELCDSEDPLFKLVEQMTDYCHFFNKISDAQKKAFEEIGGISLYIKQMERYYRSFMRPSDIGKDSGYRYKNIDEFKRLCKTMYLAEKDNIKTGNNSIIMDTRRELFETITKHVNNELELDNKGQIKKLMREKNI